jgi:hypothetical protein
MPGASTIVVISTTAVRFAVAGSLSLTGIAESEGNHSVQARATASIQIPSTTGMSAQLSPSIQILQVPGTLNFLVLVNNTGNTEDAYTATIMGTTGPVKAKLMGLNGLPISTIPLFRLAAG